MGFAEKNRTVMRNSSGNYAKSFRFPFMYIMLTCTDGTMKIPPGKPASAVSVKEWPKPEPMRCFLRTTPMILPRHS